MILFKPEQTYNKILCNTMVLSSTNIIVSKNDRVRPIIATITDCKQTHGTVRNGHKEDIIQAICIFQIPFSFNVNKLCSDKTKICLDIGP